MTPNGAMMWLLYTQADKAIRPALLSQHGGVCQLLLLVGARHCRSAWYAQELRPAGSRAEFRDVSCTCVTGVCRPAHGCAGTALFLSAGTSLSISSTSNHTAALDAW